MCGRLAIKPIFTQGSSLGFRLVLLLLVSIALMTMDHRYRHMESIRSGLSLLIYPLQYLVDVPVTLGNWIADSTSTRRALLARNDRLTFENLLLREKLQKTAALEAENTRLRDLLDSSRKLGVEVIVAELLAVDMDPFARQIVVNKGSQDQLFVGQPLLDANGVVGQILHVGPVSSTAIMINDPTHAIPVQVIRNGLRAIAVGTGGVDEGLALLNIPTNADIQEGDLLVTSGLGGRFPSGYPVGVVKRIHVDITRPYAQVLVAPSAQLDRIREVLLVQMAQPAAAGPETAPTGAE
ncbi:MAG: rod shape-determining protein MreC [Gammaproteobacteria bacterium RBG_16_57_12]|nr:MAG: rod shape-determining protein MreC [Gammaproteobacteria bacterium RBG_16_57_12]